LKESHIYHITTVIDTSHVSACARLLASI